MDYLFLIFSFIVLSAFGQSAPDYDDPYSPIFADKPFYSWTDKIKMTIIAPSWNADKHVVNSIGDTASHPIKISSSEKSLEPYRFTETGPNTGIFTAEVILTGFLHDVNGDGTFDTNPRTGGTGPTSGFLESERDSAITISFEFADRVVLTESFPITWNVGTIKFDNEELLLGEHFKIHLIDLDMNLNPELIDTVLIDVFSDSDVAGIEVDAIETGDDTGYFVAEVSLSNKQSSSGNRLFALGGDTIVAKYDDYTLPKPYAISDKKEILSSSTADSKIPPVERLVNSDLFLADNSGNETDSFNSGGQIQIVGKVMNHQDFTQKFVYLFQVRDSTNSIVHLSWIQSQISSQQTLELSQSWVPTNPGNYEVESFVWNSIEDPIVLSHVASTFLIVE